MVIVQNGKPEKDSRDASAVNVMERGPELASLWPCHFQVCDGLRHVSPGPWDPPRQMEIECLLEAEKTH